MPENRKRSFRLTLRLNDQEYRSFVNAFKKSNARTRQEYLLACVLSPTFLRYQDEYSKLEDIYLELNRWGNNLNQIAKVANTHKSANGITENVINQFRWELDEICQSLKPLTVRPH